MTEKIMERRTDIGSKIMIGLVLGGFGTIVGFFFNTLIISANAGMERANEVAKEVRQVDVRLVALESTSVEYIKRLDERFGNMQSEIGRINNKLDKMNRSER